MSSTPYREASLCRANGHSCGACCWGPQVSREELLVVLDRNRRSFKRWTKDGTRLSWWRLFLHETFSHKGRNLLWAIGLRLPVLSKQLKKKLARKLTCSFLGFDDEQNAASGCMLHPVRWEGQDVRQQNAFRMLPGIECGDPAFVCNACHQMEGESNPQRQQFVQITTGMDWYDYSETVRLVSAGIIRPDGTLAMDPLSGGTDGSRDLDVEHSTNSENRAA